MGGETEAIQQQLLNLHDDEPPNQPSFKKLSLLPLIFLIYFEVSGGPFGEEPAVKAAGPLLAISGFLIFPFIWSIPEALITAELATAFPGNGGFVIWAHEAFGPFWGFLMGTWKFFSGVINLASFPILCIDYLKLLLPILSSGFPRFAAFLTSTSALSFLNYTGLTVVGFTAIAIGIISLFPFLIMSLFAIPNLDFRRWVVSGEKGVEKNWGLFFNTLFWNLNFWDNASTLAGEVEEPQKSYPKALFSAGVLACLGYLIPLMAVTGGLPLDQEKWESGYFAEAAEMVVGKWLKYWVEIGAVLSVIGLFEAQLSSCAYQLEGMADLGFLPKIFGERSVRFNTPWVGIVISTVGVGVIGVCSMEFVDLIASANFLYSLGMVLEFGSFIWLRRKKKEELKRGFRVPMEVPGLVVMCLIPTGFLLYIMALANATVLLMSSAMTLSGVGCYFMINFFKPEMWSENHKLKHQHVAAV